MFETLVVPDLCRPDFCHRRLLLGLRRTGRHAGHPRSSTMRPGGPQLDHVDASAVVSSMHLTVDLSVVAELTIGGAPALAADTSCSLGNGLMFAVEV